MRRTRKYMNTVEELVRRVNDLELAIAEHLRRSGDVAPVQPPGEVGARGPIAQDELGQNYRILVTSVGPALTITAITLPE